MQVSRLLKTLKTSVISMVSLTLSVGSLPAYGNQTLAYKQTENPYQELASAYQEFRQFLEKHGVTEDSLTPEIMQRLLEKYPELKEGKFEDLAKRLPPHEQEVLQRILLVGEITDEVVKELGSRIRKCGIFDTQLFFECLDYQILPSSTNRTIIHLSEGMIRLPQESPSVFIVLLKLLYEVYANKDKIKQEIAGLFAINVLMAVLETADGLKGDSNLSDGCFESESLACLGLLLLFFAVGMVIYLVIQEGIFDPVVLLVSAVGTAAVAAVFLIVICVNQYGHDTTFCDLFGN